MEQTMLELKRTIKELIESNNSKEQARNKLLKSFGNFDVYCNKVQEEIGIKLFEKIANISGKLGDNEGISTKLNLRVFIDNEVNCINDMLQSKSFELLETIYAPTRADFLSGNITSESALKQILRIESNIHDYLTADYKMLKIFSDMPMMEIAKRLDEGTISDKAALKGVKKIISKGMGISSQKPEREKALKDLQIAVCKFDISITR